MERRTITVTGMTCGHCVNAVESEISKIAGVSHVDVALDTGAVTITSDHPIDDASIAGAVDEAGYEVAP